MIMVPKTSNLEMIWLKKIIKSIVRNHCKILLRVDQALWIQVFLKTS